MSEESFFKSEVVVEELQDIQKTSTDLLKMSAGLAEFSPKERLDHIEKTLELIAKQKVFYARLALASHGIEPGDESEEVGFLKSRIDHMSEVYSGGHSLLTILDQMEQKLQTWRYNIKKDLDND